MFKFFIVFIINILRYKLLINKLHVLSPAFLLIFLLRWHYSPLRTLMDFSTSALFFYLSFQFLILHLLASVCTQVHNLFFGRHFLHRRTLI